MLREFLDEMRCVTGDGWIAEWIAGEGMRRGVKVRVCDAQRK